MSNQELTISKVSKALASINTSFFNCLQELDPRRDLFRYLPSIILVHNVPDEHKTDSIISVEKKLDKYCQDIQLYYHVYGRDTEFNSLYSLLIDEIDARSVNEHDGIRRAAFLRQCLILHAKLRVTKESLANTWSKYHRDLTDLLNSYRRNYITHNGLDRHGYSLAEEPFGDTINRLFLYTDASMHGCNIQLQENIDILWYRIRLLSPSVEPLDTDSEEVNTSIKSDIRSVSNPVATVNVDTENYQPPSETSIYQAKGHTKVKITHEMVSMKYALMKEYGGWEPESARKEFFENIAPTRNASAQNMYQMYKNFEVPVAREKKVKVMSRLLDSGLLAEFPEVRNGAIEEIRKAKTKRK